MKGKIIFAIVALLAVSGCRDRFFFVDIAASDTLFAEIRSTWDTLSTDAERTAFMRSLGHPVCDIALWTDDDSLGRSDIGIPYGFNAAQLTNDLLLRHMSIRHNLLITDTGYTFRLLYLDAPADTISLDILRCLASFAEQGAVIGGVKPRAPTDSADTEAFLRLVEKTWSNGNAMSGKTIRSVLRATAAIPDMASKADSLSFEHRHLSDADIYRLSNPTSQTFRKAKIRFRVSGRQPFLFFPETGEIRPVSYRIKKGKTRVTMPLYPYETVFVVFGPYADRRKMRFRPEP